MIERISLALVNESGDIVAIESFDKMKVGVKIEITIADYFAEIRNRINDLPDEEMKCAEKFNFALNLQNFLKEMKENC